MGINAKGYCAGLKFVVFDGSIMRYDTTNSISITNIGIRQKLIKKGIVKKCKNSKHYVFVKNHTFNSKSQAASVILGSAENGQDNWKTI